MKPNDKSSRVASAGFEHRYQQPAGWLAVLSPLLRHLNTRTLALLMFVGFALLSSIRGKDADTKQSAFAATSQATTVDNGDRESPQVLTEAGEQAMLEPSSHLQFTPCQKASSQSFNSSSLPSTQSSNRSPTY
jgi:hypothetical protein